MRLFNSLFLARVSLAVFLVLPVAETRAANFDDRYVVRAGSLNGDGLPDVYLQYSPGLVFVSVGDVLVPITTSRRQLGQFALVNQGNGTFVATPLTAEQLQTVSQWPTQPVEVIARDFNVDGTVDIQLNGMEAAISGALDQIVFAPQASNALPQAVVAMTDTVRAFTNDTYAALLDPNYFNSHVPWVLAQPEPINRFYYGSVLDRDNLGLISQFLNECGGWCVVDYTDPPGGCTGTYAGVDDTGTFIGNVQANRCLYDAHIWYYDVPVQRNADYSVFNADAIAFWNAIREVSPNGVDGLVDKDPSVEPYRTLNRGLAEILRRVLGSAAVNEEPTEPQPDYYSAICNTLLLPKNNFNHAPFPLDDQFDPHATTYHHYDRRTIMCALGEYECSIARFNNSVLPRYTYPSYKLKDQLTPLDGSTWILVYGAMPWNLRDPDSYTQEVGYVTQSQLTQGNWFGAIQNITTPVHPLYPGTISRVMVASDSGNPHIFTHGIGMNQAGTIGGVGLNFPTVQMMLGCANDLVGPVIFRALDKQAERYWREHYNDPIPAATQPAALKPTS
jgi:hypothetical protein